MRQSIELAGLNNWFTRTDVEHALRQWSQALTHENLSACTERCPAQHFENDGQKTIAIIMAGNIPLVGFHDLIAVLDERTRCTGQTFE
ncbi:MAG: hypothetical protein U5L96_18035 [Owenweeksia sp.]|nr:hypothetical protein [Owenweeksia sp.]